MPVRRKTDTARQAKMINFSFPSPSASKVMLAGTFNSWNYKVTSLRKDKDNIWRTSLTLEPGKYEYKFVVDGKWMLDPSNNNRTMSSLGTENSVIEVR